MESTGWRNFTNAFSTTLSANVDWIAPTNALATGGSPTMCDLPEEETTEFLVVDTPDLPDVPANAFNRQAYIRVTCSREAGTGRTIYDNTMQLQVGGAAVGTNLANASAWFTVPTQTVYGPWSLADVTVEEFTDLGFALSAESDSTRECEVYIDHIEIEITYDLPARSSTEQIQYVA